MFTGLRAGSFEIKKYGFYAIVSFYAFAGLNHFIMPSFYLPLIPDYLQPKSTYNILAGLAEVTLAIGLYTPRFRKLSGAGVILLLLIFIPTHLHFIKVGGCISDSLCVPIWIAWGRLLLIHPLLIYWAYSYRSYQHPA